jgi:ATP-binding cassette subfamily B protein
VTRRSESPHEEELAVGRMDAGLAMRLLSYALPYRRYIVIAVSLVLLVVLLDLAGVFIVMRVLDGPLHAPTSMIESGQPKRELFIWAGVYVGVILTFCVARYAQGILMAFIGQNVMRDVRTELYRHLQNMSLSFYDSNSVGRIVTRVANDVEALNQLFSAGVVTLLADIVLLSTITLALFYIEPNLALVTMAIVPFLLVVTFIFRYFARKFYREGRAHLSHLNSFTHESIQGIDIIQLYVREKDTRERYTGINGKYLITFLKTVLCYSLYYPALEILMAVALVFILIRSGHLMQAGGLTFGTFYLFWRFLERFSAPIRDMAERYNVLQSAMAAAERIFKILDTPERVPDMDKARAPETLRGEIEYDRVSFSYNDEDYALRDFSYHVKPGETVAVVGATGAGKTSLTNLLARFYDPQDGRILVDGTDIREYQKRSYRQHLAVVLQDPFVFSRSILENIRLGNPAISDEAAMEAARRVHADGFISKLPNGYHTELNERGTMLSVGERQLLSFARALAHDPRILVLDEATAHVDTETENLIKKAVDELLANRTSIVVAHRLSTIQKADRIVVLHKGELRESGSHQELLGKKGIYYRLYQLQFLGDASDASAASGVAGN